MKRFVKVVLAALSLGMVAPASAQVHEHDGFFIRPEIGVGYLSSSASQAGDSLAIYGGAGDLSLAIGAAVRENLILALHLYGTSVSDPDMELNGAKASTRDTTNTLAGIGPQLTYYFMPINVYLSGTLALTRLSMKTNGVEGNSDLGLGGRVAVGKEWWVSDNWGLGLAAHLGLSTNKDQGADAARINTWSSGLTFSATYN